MGSLTRRYRRQAQAQAELRYGPQARGLRAILADLEGNRTTEIGAAKAMRRGTQQAIRTARPQINEAYDQNTSAVQAERDATVPVNANLGGSAESILQAALTENESAKRRVADARTQTNIDLTQQRKDAVSGQHYAIRGANQRFSADAAKVVQQLLDLAGDQGLYTATTLGDLLEKQRGRGATKANAKAGRDAGFLKKFGVTEADFIAMSPKERQTLIAEAGPKAKPKARDWVSAERQDAARTTISDATSEVTQHQALGFTSDEIADLLAHGDPGRKEIREPVYEEDPDRPGKTRKKIGPDGTPVMKITQTAIPPVKQIKDGLLVRAAIEQTIDGHISDATRRALHKAGIKIGPLGVTTRSQYERKRKREVRARGPYTPNQTGRPGVGLT